MTSGLQRGEIFDKFATANQRYFDGLEEMPVFTSRNFYSVCTAICTDAEAFVAKQARSILCGYSDVALTLIHEQNPPGKFCPAPSSRAGAIGWRVCLRRLFLARPASGMRTCSRYADNDLAKMRSRGHVPVGRLRLIEVEYLIDY